MKKSKSSGIIGFLLAVVMLVGLVPIFGTQAFAEPLIGDDGIINCNFIAPVTHQTTVPSGYTGIYTVQDLNNVRNNLGGNYILMNNIDLSSVSSWTPIGTFGKIPIDADDGRPVFSPFTGVFDGNGYEVRNLTIALAFSYDQADYDADNHQFAWIAYVGLFGDVSGTVKNLGLANDSITATKIKSWDPYYTISVGSIAGKMSDTAYIDNCYNKGSISVDKFTTAQVGGIVGSSRRNSFITNCYNAGSVSVPLPSGDTIALVGGVVGDANETGIDRCFNTGNVSAEGGKTVVGGIASGYGGGSEFPYYDVSYVFENCYNTGSISSQARGNSWGYGYAGGIVGDFYWQKPSTGTVRNCYNVGNITSGSMPTISDVYLGGIMSSIPSIYMDASVTVVENCYYLNTPQNVENIDNPDAAITNLVPLSAAQMKQQASFVGFDFATVWEIDASVNNGYPYFQSNVAPPEFAGGDGSVEAPYLVSTAAQLNNVRNYPDKNFKQTADISLSSFAEWEAIGEETFFSGTPFSGTYDGNGYKISNIKPYYNADRDENQLAIFGEIDAAGIIKNLTVDIGITYSGDITIGGIAILNYGKILSCHNIGDIAVSGNTSNNISGIANFNAGSIEDCDSKGSITYTGADSAYISGIACINTGTIARSYNARNISDTVTAPFPKGANDGGITVFNTGIIRDCQNAGNITAAHNLGLAGGIAASNGDGSNAGIIETSYNTGKIVSTGEYGTEGAIVGVCESASVITNCYYLDTSASNGVGYGDETGTTSLTKTQMADKNSFAGFDFTAVWSMDSSKNNGYPMLRKLTYPSTGSTNPPSTGGGSPPASGDTTEPPEKWVNNYIDVKATDWFYGDVEFISAAGLMNGTSTNTFSPNLSTTRGMVATVLYRLDENYQSAGLLSLDFTDVPSGAYYSEAISWAKDNGIVLGYGDNTYRPEISITREQLAAILCRYMEFSGISLPTIRSYAAFGDEASISSYAKSSVKTLYQTGIISGKPGNVFDPSGLATRAEVAAILHRFMEAAHIG